MTHTLHLDLESRSVVDLRKSGVYPYAEHPSTDVLCAAYAMDDEPVRLWTPAIDNTGDFVERLPDAIHKAVYDDWTIVAHNAAFERIMWRDVLAPRYRWPVPKLEQWQCTMVMAMALSLPASLKDATRAVGIGDGGKAEEGRHLMLQMSKPRRPRKGELPGALLWHEDPERLARLGAVCMKDVDDERELHRRIMALRPAEQRLWQLDQQINDRGVFVDVALCDAARKIVASATEALNAELADITDGIVTKTTAVTQIATWLQTRGVNAVSLDKEHLDEMLTWKSLDAESRRVLEIRKEAAKAAVKKIDALLLGRSRDGSAKGLLQFHAAGTGRWAGRRFQPQNIKRPDLDDIDGAIEAVFTGDAEYVRISYGEPLSVVGDCLRGMVRARPGNHLFAADFSNIEGRLQAWLGNEQWKLDAFRKFDAGIGHDLYKVMAGKILGKNPGDVTKAERQSHGKVPELALGYQGGVGAFQKMAAIYRVEISDEKADEVKLMWRDEHPGIVKYWYGLEDAARKAIEQRGKVFYHDRIAFRVAGDYLLMRLPSGRCIVYPYPEMREKLTPWGARKLQVSYMGIDTYTRQWTRQFAHGGLIFNNVVQGIARDIEADAIVRVEAANYFVVLSVHDEVVCETAKSFGSLEEFKKLMAVLEPIYDGLPVAVSGFNAERYRK